ncbi:hypothetical protein [Salinigranum halophilum]|uniref:hypothetical protein n=1 Tax=Salinigranum halophilum TaxID=2565931 RepID=UPI0010A8C481|nr:hypothetical protein [Salinigranum halophilum]
MSNNTTHRVNEDIERQISNLEDADVRDFVNMVVAFERRNLHLDMPRYKDEYRRYAQEHLEDN